MAARASRAPAREAVPAAALSPVLSPEATLSPVLSPPATLSPALSIDGRRAGSELDADLAAGGSGGERIRI
jgi:hypothetical protein